MRKRITLLLLVTVLSCTSLTGCVWNDIKKAVSKTYEDATGAISGAIEDHKEAEEEKEAEEKKEAAKVEKEEKLAAKKEAGANLLENIKNDNQFDMLESTKKLQQSAIFAQERANDDHSFLTQWWYDICADTATATYEAEKAGDTVYQGSVKQAEAATAQQAAEEEEEESKRNGIILAVVIAVILLIVIIVIILILKKPAEPLPQPVPMDQGTNRVSMQQMDVDYDRLLHKNCEKLGLNYDTVLADNGGDAQEAVNVTNQMLY